MTSYDPTQAWTVAPSRAWIKVVLIDFDTGSSLPAGTDTCEVRVFSTSWLLVRTRNMAGDVTEVSVYPAHRIKQVQLELP